MHEIHEITEAQPQRALLAAVDLGEYDAEVSLEELAELARSAGAEVVARVSQKRPEFDPATCMGPGRLQEIKEFCKAENIDLLIFDHELSGSQQRNIEQITNLPVVDRTTLILDIFAQRARTSEGRLQVELAQQKYRLPRLGGQGLALSRLGGGIGTRGPGESQLESDRRHIRRRITYLEEQLEKLSNRRELTHRRRAKDGVITAAIVGYTNVGKSTLLNALTQAGVLAEDRLFATLDPTARALTLPDGRTVMLIDTVGLVRRLPHHLVEAFRSTLEEASHADLLLNVCDISSDEVEEQLAITKQLMAELGAADTPVLTVLNKCDKVEQIPLPVNDQVALISAKTGFGFEELLRKIALNLRPSQVNMTLLLPYDQAGLLAKVREEGKVLSEGYTPEGILAQCLVEQKILYLVQQYAR